MNTHHPMDCPAAMAQLWDYLDKELDDAGIAAVKEHLASCSHCLPHAKFAESFLEALRRCRHPGAMPDQVRHGVMETLRKAGLLQGGP